MELHDTELERQLREALSTAAAPVQGHGVQQEAVRQEATRRAVARRQRARWGLRLSLVAGAAAAIAALVLVTRSDSGRVDMSDEPGSTTSTEVTTPSSSSTTSPDSSTTSTTASSTTSTSSSSSTTSTTTAPPALPEFPPEFTGVTQGGQAWALYLAVVPAGQYDAPELAAANTAATAAGYGGAGPSDLACDQGAAEALGRDSSSVASAVHFETEAQANQARAAFEARDTQVVGVVNVTTYCLD